MVPILKAMRGFKFTAAMIEHLLKAIDEVIPIKNPNWERIWQEHSSHYSTKEWTTEQLKHKFQELACRKVPTGDPNCLPYIRYAKQIYYKIVQATDGLTGGSDRDIGEKADENKMHGGGGADNDDDVDNKDEEEEESDRGNR